MGIITSITRTLYLTVDLNNTNTRITEVRQSHEDIQTQSSSSSPQISKAPLQDGGLICQDLKVQNLISSCKALRARSRALRGAQAQDPKTATESSSSDSSAQPGEEKLHRRYQIMHLLATYETLVTNHSSF